MKLTLRLPAAGARTTPAVAGGFLRRNRRRWLALAVLLVAAAAAGAMLGQFLRFDLPDVQALEDYNPPQMTRVMATDGSEVDSFAEQRRISIEYRDVPAVFRQALLSIEDSNFERHAGVDFRALLRAAWHDVTRMKKEQGASTLTQQLAKNLFLHPDKTIRRKVQEAVLALEIERQYTKEEILRYYVNQIYMGHGRYGVEAASRFYFDKSARDLDLNEAATLAGLIQIPERLSPVRHPERARQRRDTVLRRMVDEGYISSDEAAATIRQAIHVTPRKGSRELAPYYVEEVRRFLQKRYGSSSLYKEGLVVGTTLDPRLQDIANRAVDAGLRELDKRQGWRGAPARVPAGQDPHSWNAPGWDAGVAAGEVTDGVVLRVDGRGALVRAGPFEGLLDAKAVAWTGKNPVTLLRAGDVVRVRAGADDGSSEDAFAFTLEQEPAVEAALVALDPSTGAVLALVGGFDFDRSEFDRAMQARRQTGSAFKPFVYAAALAQGFTLADSVVDEPTVFLDPQNPQPYQPENYTHQYYGRVTLREALARSANISTVKLLDAVGYRPVIEMAERLGLSSQLQPYPSLALGAFESNLIELTAAYGAFANQGVLVEPHLVTEVTQRDGVVLDRFEPAVRDAVSPEIAFLMNRLLAGVISDGTGRAARALDLPLAGKTGTTDENTDAWFIGYSSRLVVGVWVGFDERRSLGSRETGAQAALPIWQRFMEEAHRGLATEDFPAAPGVITVAVDRATGLKANRQAGCTEVLSESFVRGTEPAGYCTAAHHRRLQLPYAFQAFALGDDGALQIPADELDRLIARFPQVELGQGGRRLEFHGPAGAVSIALDLLAAHDDAVDPYALPTQVAGDGPNPLLGVDGQPARVVWMDGRTLLASERQAAPAPLPLAAPTVEAPPDGSLLPAP